MEYLSRILIIAASISLIWRRGIIYPHSLLPFEILIIMAAGLTLFSLTVVKKEKLLLGAKILAALLILFTIGLTAAFLQFGLVHPDIPKGLFLDYYFLLTAGLAFLLIIYYNDQNFTKNILWAFLAPLLLAPFLWLPQLTALWQITYAGRFLGFHPSSTVFASYLLISLIILTVFFIKAALWSKKFIYWLGLIFLLALAFWTLSRALWLAFLVALPFIILINKKSLTFNLAMTVLAILAAFQFLPLETKTDVWLRAFPRPLSADTERLTIWRQALKLIAGHPLGLGLEYYRFTKEIKAGGQEAGAHNTFFNIVLAGGWLALLAFLFFIYKVSQNLKNNFDQSGEWLILSAGWLGLLTIMLVDDRFLVPWFWIIAGLALSYRAQIKYFH